MAVMLKKKPKTTPKPAAPKFMTANDTETATTELSQVADLIDQIGGMADEVEKAKAVVRSYDTKVKALRQWADTVFGADEEVTELGKEFKAILGPRGTVRSIADTKALFDHMGKELFLKLAKVNLTDIDKYLTPEEAEKVLRKRQTGTRKLSVVAHDE